MITLENKAKKVCIIINPKKEEKTFPPDFYVDLNQWLIENASIYAYALHDLDITEEGEAKRDHIHIVAELEACTRMITTLNKLAAATGCDNQQISIQKCSDFTGAVQYLVHKNNPDKHQYEASDIITNLSPSDLKGILEAIAANCSIEYLIGIVATSPNLVSVIRKLGLETYKEYRFVVQDLWKERKLAK